MNFPDPLAEKGGKQVQLEDDGQYHEEVAEVEECCHMLVEAVDDHELAETDDHLGQSVEEMYSDVGHDLPVKSDNLSPLV